jgi:hypothetical protein
MTMTSETIDASVHIGDGVVVVKRKGSSLPAVANILGTLPGEDGQRVFLDRLVHRAFERELAGFPVSGAISSILVVPDAVLAAGKVNAT